MPTETRPSPRHPTRQLLESPVPAFLKRPAMGDPGSSVPYIRHFGAVEIQGRQDTIQSTVMAREYSDEELIARAHRLHAHVMAVVAEDLDHALVDFDPPEMVPTVQEVRRFDALSEY